MAPARRLRTYLTRNEVASLLRSAQKGRHGSRNHATILIAYRHGLRASELVGLRGSDVDLERGTIYCRRAKGSRSSVHPLKADEVSALDHVLRASRTRAGDYVFRSERGEWMSRGAFWRVVAQAGKRAGLPVHAHAHILRHSDLIPYFSTTDSLNFVGSGVLTRVRCA